MQISIEYLVFHGNMSITVEYFAYMIRGTGDRAVGVQSMGGSLSHEQDAPLHHYRPHDVAPGATATRHPHTTQDMEPRTPENMRLLLVRDTRQRTIS